MKPEMYPVHFEIQKSHWWFKTKKAIALDFIRRHSRETGPMKILDIGCGTGLMLDALSRLGETSGMDASEDAIHFSRKIFQGEVKMGFLPDQVPFEKERFDLITALDVLEHIDRDRESMAALLGLVKPGGMAVLTVPAGMELWSGHDVINEHKRRYTRAEFGRKLKEAGWQVERLTYFNSLLYPPILLARVLARLFRAGGVEDLKTPNPLVNMVFGAIFGLEKPFLRHFNFPVGVSVLAVVRRPG